MNKILIFIAALCLPGFVYALELDTPIIPGKNMTEGSLFSSSEEIAALEGDIWHPSYLVKSS